LDGKSSIKVPAGTQPGTMFRLKGKGVKNIQGYGHGDLHVRITVEVPSQLTGAQKAKLEEFAALCNGKESPLSQGFFDKAKKLFK
jgi:molecular chaperone DnaJ